MKPKRTFPNQSGQLLLQVLLGLGALSAVAFNLIQISTQSKKALQSLRQSGDFEDLARATFSYLQHPGLCKCNLTQSAPGTPRTFSAANAPTTQFDLDGLKLFDATDCTPGAWITQTVSTQPTSGLWLQALKLKNLTKVDDSTYTAQLVLNAQKTSQQAAETLLARELPIRLAVTTDTTAGTVTLDGCQAGTQTAPVGPAPTSGEKKFKVFTGHHIQVWRKSECEPEGDYDGTTYGWTCGPILWKTPISFPEPFTAPPFVITAIERNPTNEHHPPGSVGYKNYTSQTYHASVFPENITVNGFTIRSGAINMNGFQNGKVGWIAIGY